MCFNKPQKSSWNFDNDSEAMDTNWQEIFNIYLLKMENETKRALKIINDDIERKGSTMNQKLKDCLLQLTNARISQAHEEFDRLAKHEAQLFTKSSEESRDDNDSGPKKMTVEVCDQGTSMEQTSDHSAQQSLESKCNTSHPESIGLSERCVDSNNESELPNAATAVAAASPSLCGTPSTESFGANTSANTPVAANAHAADNDNEIPYNITMLRVESLNALFNSRPSFPVCPGWPSIPRSPPQSQSESESESESECNDEEFIGSINESIEENMDSFGSNSMTPSEPAITPSEPASTPILPKLAPDVPLLPGPFSRPDFMKAQCQPTPSNLWPILSPIYPYWSYSQFPLPAPFPFHN